MTSSGVAGGNDGLGGAVALSLGAAAVVIGVASFAFCRRPSATPPPQDLEGMTVCITGGNIGIGRATALILGRRGARVLIGCRNVEQAQEVCQKIGSHVCHAFSLDLSNPSSIRNFSMKVLQHTQRTGLHLLINNAGAMIREEDKTMSDGWDRTMAVNHLGWVQLTQSLYSALEQTAARASTTQKPVRIINVGSKLEKQAILPTRIVCSSAWDEWMKQTPTNYNSFSAYANSKLAMTATTFYWSKINPTVPMVLVSPGMVNTSLPRFMPLWKRVLSLPFRAMLLKTPEQGAETVVFAATNPAIQGGKYYSDCKEIQDDNQQCSEAARSLETQRLVWEATQRALQARQAQLRQEEAS